MPKVISISIPVGHSIIKLTHLETMMAAATLPSLMCVDEDIVVEVKLEPKPSAKIQRALTATAISCALDRVDTSALAHSTSLALSRSLTSHSEPHTRICIDSLAQR